MKAIAVYASAALRNPSSWRSTMKLERPGRSRGAALVARDKSRRTEPTLERVHA
jgi:hypothetical protein